MKIGRVELAVLVLVTMLAIAVTEKAQAQAVLMPVVNNEILVSPPQPISNDPMDRRRVLPPQPAMLPFRVASSQVHVRIEENVATTTMEQSFQNLSGQNLEVRVMIPLPNGAAINSSSLSMNESMVEGQLHNATEAQSIYESIVVRRKDPSLLRFAGENMYEARIFPVAPNELKRFKFSYTQVLTQDGGLYDLRHILSGSQLYATGVEKFSLDVTVRSKNAIGPVYSPTHKVQVERPDENTATVKLASDNLSSDRDFRLLFAPAANDIALRLLTHRSGDEDGYFMLVGRADSRLENAKIIPKEIVFVLDISGSMQGEKMDQARAAMKFCLNSLNERDRFNFISFSTDVTPMANNLLQATKENIKKAVAAVDQLEATGGTNIDGALKAAFANDFTDGPTTSKMVVFMTDGLPTVGNTDPESILETVQKSNGKNKARFFNFGVGNDVNTHFLDNLAGANEGVTSYVAPREDIEIKVSEFYNKIRHPFMTDVTIDYGPDGKANAIYPRKLPALYRGTEFMLVGRFKGSGPGHITVTGSVAGEQRQIQLDVNWPTREVDNAYLPRVWAMRKIGHLMEDLRLHGNNAEIVQELVTLAQRHGIVTPYTSQLVVEPGFNQGQPQPVTTPPIRRNREDDTFGATNAPGDTFKSMNGKDALAMQDRTKSGGVKEAEKVQQFAQSTNSGEVAVALATVERELKDADKAGDGLTLEGKYGPAAAAKPNAPADKKGKEEAYRQIGAAMRAGQAGGGGRYEDGQLARPSSDAQDEELGEKFDRAQTAIIKQVGDRTFYNRGGVWVDSSAKADAKPTIVKLFSAEYFELVKSDTTLGAVLAMGSKIIVVSKDKTFQIEE